MFMHLKNALWFELHSHSYYSKATKIKWEGISSPAQVVRTAKRKGLGGIALTDHSTTKGWKEASREAEKIGIIFIPGIEIDSGEGHILAYGINEIIKDNLGLMETLDRIRAQGGVSAAAHPYDIRGMGCRELMDRADMVEVFNSLNMDRFSNWKAERRAKNLGLRMIAGSDAHTLDMIGASRNLVPAYDMDSFLKNIKKENNDPKKIGYAILSEKLKQIGFKLGEPEKLFDLLSESADKGLEYVEKTKLD